MGIFNLVRVLAWLFRRPIIEWDYPLDSWIREALFDDALARPPSGAWERLRQVIIERQLKNYGMWVLDEPQHDPPESPPMLLDGHEFERALRIHGDYLAEGNDPHQNVTLGLLPMFSAIVNW